MNNIEKIAINTRSNNVKKPTTIEEQIKLLKSREVVIEDENFAKKFIIIILLQDIFIPIKQVMINIKI